MKRIIAPVSILMLVAATCFSQGSDLNFGNSEIESFLLNETDAGSREKQLYDAAMSGSVDDCIRYLNSEIVHTDSYKVKARILSAAKSIEDYAKVANALPDKRVTADYNARNLVLGTSSYTIGNSSGTRTISDAESYIRHFPNGTYVQEMRQFIAAEQEKQRQQRAAEAERERQRQAQAEAERRRQEEARSPRNWQEGQRVRASWSTSGVCAGNCSYYVYVVINWFNPNRSRFNGTVVSIGSHGLIFKDKGRPEYEGKVLYEGYEYMFNTGDFELAP
ncbi:MAG: hypothetical protein H6601_10580 [Flavobacteriales bacterium]|nr:hypothetical protein [Flavobacteriales bacterium]MCB9205515.1 hypothetical protein [Flavobacteriales bacterium]